MLRRFAYRYSEARAAHWLLLLAADRVNAVESHLASLITKRPDNPITETGISAEIGRGASARRGTTRVDKTHSWIDPILVSAPWVAGAVAVAYVARQSAKRLVA
jgi:hypothetical protein